MKQILVVGGGTSGTLAANLLGKSLKKEIKNEEVKITLIDNDGKHIFQPNYLYIGFKGSKPNSVEKEEAKLLQKRINFVIDPVSKIDLDNRAVRTANGGKYEYDYLVLAMGAEVAPDEIPGFSKANIDFHSTPDTARGIWERINQIKKGKVVVGLSAFPHKCPPSPVEAAFLAEEFFKKKKLKDQVEIHFVTPLQRPYPEPTISKTVEKLFDERGIQLHPFFNIDSVNPEKQVIYSMEGSELKYDSMFVVPYHKAPQVSIDSELGDEDGWIPADKYTMLVNGRDDVYAIGDVADLRTAKSGVTAHLEGVVTARNITSNIKGTGETCRFTGRTHCPMDVGYGKALFVITTYDKPAKDVKPSRKNLLLKKSFAKMYWTAVKGSLEWLFDRYFGEDARDCFYGEYEPTSP
ncbi:MAG: NAD(P)/FAD-dependent oxidoreductase [Promethearchaeota archaeon]